MATWITHLRVAEAFKSLFNEREYQNFLIGNIAPDSGMLNEDNLTYTPPSEVSHYLCHDVEKWKNNNLNFYNKYLNQYRLTKTMNDDIAFKLGYFFHLFLDNLWGYYIYRPVKDKFSAELLKNPQFIWDIKKDWYGIDQEFIYENQKWETWNKFNTLIYDNDFLDFYPNIAINNKLKSIKEFYNNGEKIKRPYLYLTNQEMNNFIELSVKWIREGLELLQHTTIGNYKSIMQILEKEHKSFQKEFGDLKRDSLLITN